MQYEYLTTEDLKLIISTVNSTLRIREILLYFLKSQCDVAVVSEEKSTNSNTFFKTKEHQKNIQLQLPISQQLFNAKKRNGSNWVDGEERWKAVTAEHSLALWYASYCSRSHSVKLHLRHKQTNEQTNKQTDKETNGQTPRIECDSLKCDIWWRHFTDFLDNRPTNFRVFIAWSSLPDRKLLKTRNSLCIIKHNKCSSDASRFCADINTVSVQHETKTNNSRWKHVQLLNDHEKAVLLAPVIINTR